MSLKKMTDTRQLRSINRASILDLIRTEEPLSRAQVARRLGLSTPTVLRIVDELIQDGLVTAIGKQENMLGRPGELLKFNGGSHLIVSIDLGCPEMIGMVADLCGNVLFEHQTPLYPGNGAMNLESLDALVTRLLDCLKDDPREIRGIAVGVPGGNNNETGVVLQSIYLGWENLPISERLFKKFRIPVYLESDINIFTLGEHGFGAARGMDNFICLTLGSKILCGFMLNGALHRGNDYRAGLLGNTFPFPQSLQTECSLGDGWLDQIAAGPNLFKAAVEKTKTMHPDSLPPLIDMLSVYRAAEEGYPWAKEIIDPALLHISQMIGNLSLTLNPKAIIIAGKAAGAGEQIRREVLTHLHGKIPVVPDIRISTLGSRSFVCGAAVLIYRGAFANV